MSESTGFWTLYAAVVFGLATVQFVWLLVGSVVRTVRDRKERAHEQKVLDELRDLLKNVEEATDEHEGPSVGSTGPIGGRGSTGRGNQEYKPGPIVPDIN